MNMGHGREIIDLESRGNLVSSRGSIDLTQIIVCPFMNDQYTSFMSTFCNRQSVIRITYTYGMPTFITILNGIDVRVAKK